MKFIFELSKEHKTLPTSEILACLKAEDINYNLIEINQDVLVVDLVTKNDKINPAPFLE